MTHTTQAGWPGPPPPPRRSFRQRRPVVFWLLVLGIPLLVLGGCTVAVLGSIAQSAQSAQDADVEGVEGAEPGASPAGDADEGDGPRGVVKYGETVRFGDGSTLVARPPERFTPNEFSQLEGYEDYVRFRVTFTNRTDEVYEPALTTGAVTSAGEEGASVFGPGLDAPENPVLPGKSVSWWMGYGVRDPADVQLTVTMGFLDYRSVTFTR